MELRETERLAAALTEALAFATRADSAVDEARLSDAAKAHESVSAAVEWLRSHSGDRVLAKGVARLYLTAPISSNLVLAYIGQHVLGLPKSY